MTMLIYKDNENLVEIDLLKNAATDEYINDALVTATIKDSTGTVVTGDTFPKTLSYVAASNGKYQAALSNSLVLIPGRHYTAFITASVGGLDASWEIPLLAALRTS